MTSESVPGMCKQVQLASYPEDEVTEDNLAVVETALPAPADGEVVVRNEWMALGTVYRDQMRPDIGIPIPVFQIGQPMWGRSVGTVVASNSPVLSVGDLVEHFFGWRDYAVGNAYAFFPRDRGLLPAPEYFLSNGPTAWRGMVDIAQVGDGDVVFVSGATSGVGSMAGQIAKARGASRVIGSTGSKEKVSFLLDEAGFDAAFNYRDGAIADRLKELAPDGITVCFDNVGGEQLEAAIEAAAPQARFALCGSLAAQHGQWEMGRPRLNLMGMIPRELSLRGFATLHTPEQISDWNAQFSGWLAEDRIQFPHTKIEGGVENLPQAIIGQLRGNYSGMTLTSLS
jgi:NADPH-dependent curcumin reductase CurA